MPPEKLLDFLVSTEFYQLIDKTDEFLKIDPKVDGEKDGKVTFFLDRYFRERLSEPILKNYAKQILDFLSDEETNNLLNFIQQNFFDLKEKLWQGESMETTGIVKKILTTNEKLAEKAEKEKPKISEEVKQVEIKKITLEETENLKPMTFEEKEKKYQEIIGSLVKQKLTQTSSKPPESLKPLELTTKPLSEQKTLDLNKKLSEQKEFKTITFEPEEKHPEEKSSKILPETTIIIRKTGEKKPEEGQDKILDLSKL